MYRTQGYPDKYIQALATRSDPKTTKIYFNVGEEALEDRHYRTVSAGLSLDQ